MVRATVRITTRPAPDRQPARSATPGMFLRGPSLMKGPARKVERVMPCQEEAQQREICNNFKFCASNDSVALGVDSSDRNRTRVCSIQFEQSA